MKHSLAAAASAAIAAVYAVGVLTTQSQSGQAAIPTSSSGVATPMASAAATVLPAASTPAVATPTQIARAIAAATATPTPATSPAGAGASTARYRDGTFSGTGSSRRGEVTVQVTIAVGQITDVKISHSTTYYPITDIARLPGQVVSRQSASVDVVSGATESTKAFRSAVSQALAQASSSTLAPNALQGVAGAV